MAMSKAHLFDDTAYRQSIWNKAIAHPARATILLYLKEHGITPFKEIRKLIPLARTTVCQHVAKLRKEGLINIKEEYPYSYYYLDEKTCSEFAALMKEFDARLITMTN